MDKQYIEENDIGINYLRNKLTPEENEQFEIYLMEHPEMVEELEILSTFKEALPQSVRSSNDGSNSFLAKWFKPAIGYSVAFSLGILTFSLINTIETKHLGVAFGTGYQHVLSEPVRGSSSQGIQTIDVDAREFEYLNLVAITGDIDEQEYIVDLYNSSDGNTKPVFKGKRVTSNVDGEIAIVLSVAMIEHGPFSVMLKNQSSGDVRDYSFQVIRAEK